MEKKMTRYTISKTMPEKSKSDGSYMAISAMAASMRQTETQTNAGKVLLSLFSKAA